MRSIPKRIFVNDKRANERGASLVMTIMVAALLLAAGGALIWTTCMSTTLAVDSTAEAQAYYAAEAGLNSALTILRGNVASTPPGTAATFRTAANDPTLDTWLQYHGNPHGTQVVSLSNNPALDYTVAVSDPDATPNSTQPSRLLVRVTGYGPKGAI